MTSSCQGTRKEQKPIHQRTALADTKTTASIPSSNLMKSPKEPKEKAEEAS
ncbi:hypothetical protein [Phocaeicola sartorii]|uniref:hypothetical protein n=1 Tax=Phocaeicola sartorii TaxID=671267 RepID=UPI00248BBD74|nr:hypothetical protein [Phocaeicola sartorii]